MSNRAGSVTRLGIVAIVAATLLGFTGRAQQQELPVATLPNDSARTARAFRVLEAIRQGLPYVPGELLVRFNASASAGTRMVTLAGIAARSPDSRVKWLGEIAHLTNIDQRDLMAASRDLASRPEVVYVQPNYLTSVQAVPNDLRFHEQWNMRLINMPGAWDINGVAGDPVTVAVIDSGLTTRSGAFGFRLWRGFSFGLFTVPFRAAEDFDHSRVLEAADLQLYGGWDVGGAPLVFDAHGHGTHVAGTIAQQTNNSLGYAGVAHGVRLLPIKACFSPWDIQIWGGVHGIPGFAPNFDLPMCETAAVIEGIRLAIDRGAKVINLSLGGPVPEPAFLEVLGEAVSRGAFVAIASGNAGNDVPQYPAFYAAAIQGVMSVGAVSSSSQRADYSSFGPALEVVAPGGSGESLSTFVWQMGPNQADLDFLTRLAPAFDRYQPYASAGTSMASPHVAAVAALLYSQGITNPAAIEAAIKRFARDLGAPGRDDEFGYGLIDARASLRGFGVGR